MIEVKHIDALQFLKDIENESVDLIITDPPWAIGKKEYDKFRLDPTFVVDCFRILKPSCSLLLEVGFAGETLYDWIFVGMKAGFSLRQSIVLYLTNGIGRRSYVGWNCFSLVLWFGKSSKDGKAVKPIRKYRDVIPWSLISNKKEGWTFPNPKSIDAYRTLIRMFSKENDLVIDPFLGSGTTALACKAENRNFLGCDIDQKYVNLSMRRLLLFQEKKVKGLGLMK